MNVSTEHQIGSTDLARAGSKLNQAAKIYLRNTNSRPHKVLDKFEAKLGVTRGHASTYFYMLQHRHKALILAMEKAAKRAERKAATKRVKTVKASVEVAAAPDVPVEQVSAA
jgi:hypothetical protein